MQLTVNRIACSIAPALTSSQRTRPGKIGRPAASADVQVAGRRSFAFGPSRWKIAPLPAVGSPPFHSAAYSSYSVHVSRSIMFACRSDPPSTWMSGPNGYGPGSLSSS